MIRLEMKNYNTILTEKQAKISTLSSGKINKYKYLTSEEILPPDQRRVKNKQEQFRIKKNSKEKQLKIMETNWLNVMSLLKRILILIEIAGHFKSKKIYLMIFLKKGLLDLEIKKEN